MYGGSQILPPPSLVDIFLEGQAAQTSQWIFLLACAIPQEIIGWNFSQSPGTYSLHFCLVPTENQRAKVSAELILFGLSCIYGLLGIITGQEAAQCQQHDYQCVFLFGASSKYFKNMPTSRFFLIRCLEQSWPEVLGNGGQ